MELTVQLSNPSKLLQRLLALPLPKRDGKPVRPALRPQLPKRRLGDVRDAIIAVLAEEGDFLRVSVIYERVVQRLEGPPPTYDHVRDSLNHRSRGEKQLFERQGYGRYRLASSEQVARGLAKRKASDRQRRFETTSNLGQITYRP